MIGSGSAGHILLAVAALALISPNRGATEPRAARPDFHATMLYPAREPKSPQATAKVPGILVLGGAEGGDAWAKAVAQRLAEHGYAALAEAYFGSPGLEPQLQQIRSNG